MSSDISTLFSFPGTGLDTDSDLVTIQNGDSRYRLNAVLSDDSNHNVVTNSLGNELKSHTLPTGTNTVVGYVEDKENSAGIYFLHNSSNNHCIIRYNSSSDTFTNILYEEPGIIDSNFTTSKQIDAGIIGNEDDQFLVWADGGILKMINIAYAIAGNYGSPISEEELSFYKYPLYSNSTPNITANYATDVSKGLNSKIRNKVFQFAVRLKYYDKTFSVLSNHSEIPLINENIPSGKISEGVPFNHISVNFGIDNEPSIVDSYQLLYRIADIGGGVPGSWYIYDEYDHSAKGFMTVDFFNDKSMGFISSLESIRPFDYVPNKVNHVGIIDANRVVIDEGEVDFDNVVVSANVSVNEVSLSNEGVVGGTGDAAGSKSGNLPDGSSLTISVPLDETVDYNFHLSLAGNPYSLYTYGLTEQQVYDIFADYFNGNPAGLSVVSTPNTPSTGDYSLVITNNTGNTVVYSYTVFDRCPYYRSLKTGASYKFGVEYGYNGKRGTVQTGEVFSVDVDDVKDLTSTYTNYAQELSIQMTSQPPIGATDFRFVSFGSDVDYFEEYCVRFNSLDITDDSSNYTMFLEEPYTVIKRADMINRMRSAYGDASSGIGYGMEIYVGDTIKFIGYFTTAPSNDSDDKYDVFLQKSEYSYRIESVTSQEIRISSSAIRRVEDDDNSISDGLWCIQVIRHKDSISDIAEEFSLSYPISDHGDVINVTDVFADVWKSKQVFTNELNYSDYGLLPPDIYSYSWMEKPKISLYYDSRPTDQGRDNAVNSFAEQRGYNRIRWGGKFLDDLGVNYLTSFNGADYKELDDRNGMITKIIQIGDTLKVYQERKSNSLYLKTTSSDDPNGTSTFVFSDNVMSDPRQSVPDYGCTHFSSYAKNVRVGYFFDIVNKTVLRDSQGGIRSISDGEYKMHTYFKEKANAILEYGKDLVQIYGVYDDDFDFYTIAFIVPGDTSHSINDSLSFHEPSGRWSTHFPTPVGDALQFMGRLSGKPIVSFVDGELYLHTVNAVRNNFWGEQSHSEVWIHANEAPHLNKIFDSVEINSEGCWCLPEEDSIEITKPLRMRSRIVQGKFKLQEGIFRSEFLRNALNGAGAFIRNLLVNGKILRGREMTLKLKNTDTTESQLETVTVRSTVSK